MKDLYKQVQLAPSHLFNVHVNGLGDFDDCKP